MVKKTFCLDTPNKSPQCTTDIIRYIIYMNRIEKITFTAMGVKLRAGEDVLQNEGQQSFLEFGIRGVQYRRAG